VSQLFGKNDSRKRFVIKKCLGIQSEVLGRKKPDF
jgi:hypothetical protein